uniref:Predicted protein n=1 Tax=Hordeum vulgare subsp. vulgare TaxID=112509 RepID=F2DJX8_HORVV|nr:predicted protein [Hordeum vulgare subsp. vulgare]
MRPYKFVPLPQPPGLSALSSSSCGLLLRRHLRPRRPTHRALPERPPHRRVPPQGNIQALRPCAATLLEPEVVLPPIPPPRRQHNPAAPGKWSETTMLVIDMQKDFVDTAMCSPVLVAGGEAVVPTVAEAVAVPWERDIFIGWVISVPLF